ncbi:hypothetical protein H0H93_008874 [Arthromyces matolae]|nr:hypothetical protein H0H93_008874 [Arthromyces matolae]
MPYDGSKYFDDYHGSVKGTELGVRVRVWRYASVSEEFVELFNARLGASCAQWKRVSGHENILPVYGLQAGARGTRVGAVVTPLLKEDINQHLLQTPNADQLQSKPKLTDLGLQYLPESRQNAGDGSEHDNVRWMAHEILSPPPHLQGEYDNTTPETDVYSFGMTMLEVLTGVKPWGHIRRPNAVMVEMLSGSQRPRRPQHKAITDPIWKLIELCISVEPHNRPTMKRVRSCLQSLLLQTDGKHS